MIPRSAIPIGGLLSGCLLGGLLFLGEVEAHEGPEHEIEALSERLTREGDRADLLLERAIEYRVLGRWAEAAQDLQRAVRLTPTDGLLLRELAQIELQRGRVSEALTWVGQALQLPGQLPAERAAVLMIRSQCRVAAGAWTKALDDCSEALHHDPQRVSAYLERSALQRRLRRHRERISGLEEGIRRTGAGLLVAERVEALLDDGQWTRALEAIEPELNAARLQGTWKLRRARALQGLARRTEADQDLRSALEEIDSRMPAVVREPSLLMDRGRARELLGQTEAAIQDYRAAAECGGGAEALHAVQRLQGRMSSPWGGLRRGPR